MRAHLSLSSTVTLTPLRAGLAVNQDNLVDVRPHPGAGHPAERPPQALVLVLDRSGAMNGRPLAEALRCADYVLRTLRPVDVASVAQFDNRVKRLWPAAPLGDGN